MEMPTAPHIENYLPGVLQSGGLSTEKPLGVLGVGIFAGTGAPSFTAPKGSLYSRKDGSSTSTRLYVNTDGGTTWTNVTTAA